PHGKDHAIFIAFAPKEDPKIAIAVYDENAGFGASTAAPLASLMIERYLTESIDPSRKWLEDRILNLNPINERKQQFHKINNPPSGAVVPDTGLFRVAEYIRCQYRP